MGGQSLGGQAAVENIINRPRVTDQTTCDTLHVKMCAPHGMHGLPCQDHHTGTTLHHSTTASYSVQSHPASPALLYIQKSQLLSRML